MTPSVHIKSSGLHASRTCEGSQFDAAGHVVVKVDPPAFVVALDDGVHSRGADAVAWNSEEDINISRLVLFQNVVRLGCG